MPPPETPMLPMSSWMIVKQRMFSTPIVCCVMPSAYIITVGVMLEKSSAAFLMSATGIPVIAEAFSNV